MNRDADRGEAGIVKTGYGIQQKTVIPAVEAKLLQKIKCGICKAQIDKNAVGKSKRRRKPRLCKKCWQSTLQRRDTKGPGAKADEEDTAKAEGESSLAAPSAGSTSCQSRGATKVRIRARNRTNRAQKNYVKILGPDKDKVTMSQLEEGVTVAVLYGNNDIRK